jgi:hypothetical protein
MIHTDGRPTIAMRESDSRPTVVETYRGWQIRRYADGRFDAAQTIGDGLSSVDFATVDEARAYIHRGR